MAAFWILLALSVFHFALAAPVAVRDTLEVRSNPAKVFKDGITPWEKRVDSDDKVQWSTNDAHLMDAADTENDPVHLDDAPGGDEKSIDVEGIKDKEMWQWESPQENLGSNPPEEEFRVDDKDNAPSNDHVSDDKDQSSDAHLTNADAEKDSIRPDDTPGFDEENVNIKDKETWEWASPQNLEKLGSSIKANKGPEEEFRADNKDNAGITSDDKDQWWTSDAHLTNADPGKDSVRPDVAPPGGDEKGADAEGVRYSEGEMWGWETPWDPELSGLAGGMGSDASVDNNPPQEESGVGSDHATQSPQGSAENTSPGPHSENPATPKHQTLFDKILGFLRPDVAPGGDEKGAEAEGGARYSQVRPIRP